MSDFIQALDVITKLLPQLKSFTGARRREYFTALIEPLFAAFEDIHDFYLNLIVQTREEVIRIGWKNEFAFQLRQDRPLSPKQIAALEKVRRSYGRRRQKDERLRDTVRQDSHQMLIRISWPEERRFLVAVGEYFLGDEHVALTSHDMEWQVSQLIQRGGDSYWRTPSSELEVELAKSPDLRSALRTLDDMRHALNQRYMNVRHTFKTVHHTIIEKT